MVAVEKGEPLVSAHVDDVRPFSIAIIKAWACNSLLDSSTKLFFERTLSLENKTLHVRIQRFENGRFVSVSEGGQKIGSLVVSLATGAGEMPVTTTIIPPRSPDSAFVMRLAAEQISSRIGGIVLFSMFVQKDLSNDDAKSLLSGIMEMISDDA